MAKSKTMTEQEKRNVRENLERDARSRLSLVRKAAKDALLVLASTDNRARIQAACDEVTRELELYLDC